MEPGDVHPAAVAGVADVLALIVAPAVAVVLTPEEVQAISLDRRQEPGGQPAWYAHLELTVMGERFVDRVYEHALDVSVTEWRNRLASNLQDFVAESRFGWGQERPLPTDWTA